MAVIGIKKNGDFLVVNLVNIAHSKLFKLFAVKVGNTFFNRLSESFLSFFNYEFISIKIVLNKEFAYALIGNGIDIDNRTL